MSIRHEPVMPDVWIWVPRWHPAKLNALLKVHWAKAHRIKTNDKNMIWAHSPRDKRAITKRRLELTIILKKGQRGADPDAYNKSLLDALVACRLLTDDNHQGVELMPVVYRRGTEAEWGTEIRLWDV